MRDVDQLVKFNEFAPVNEKFSSVPGLERAVSHLRMCVCRPSITHHHHQSLIDWLCIYIVVLLYIITKYTHTRVNLRRKIFTERERERDFEQKKKKEEDFTNFTTVSTVSPTLPPHTHHPNRILFHEKSGDPRENGFDR
jgi:hypothetical protein